ncbi:MAG: RNA methyltransferase [Proteobacteria bacterium]|nr:RNA methyltransferase [Pseudomonadota bacterium]MBU1688519.1 RNA methyltransferase [Pseudomonadota bacterium]
MSYEDGTISTLLDQVAIVLVEPKYPENIGAAARVAKNTGISRLIVVRQEPPDREKMLKMATHKAADLIDHLEFYPDLASALADFQVVVATTARQGRQRRPPNTPRVVMEKILPLLTNNKTALMFGPEHRGLTNDDLKYCHFTSTIPTADFSSLNLAQAVGIHCHELYHALLYGTEALSEAVNPKQATTREMEGMYSHLEELLTRIDFLKDNNGENDYWMNSIRKFLGRLGLLSKEVKMIRGFCRQFLWYEDQQSIKPEE